MKKIYLLFSACLICALLALSSEAQPVIQNSGNDSCHMLVTFSFKDNGIVDARHRVTAFELIGSYWHIYINGIDSFTFHQDSLISFQMMY